MKPIVRIMCNNGENLPLEYPVQEVMKIYGKRLFIFFVVVVANLVLFGVILLISRYLVLSLSILVVVFLSILYVNLWLRNRLARQQLRAATEMFAEIQELGEIDSDEFPDAVIVLLWKIDMEAESREFSKQRYVLPQEVITFVRELREGLMYSSREVI